ncbi:RDD family protein [Streptomyces sp. NPDC004327]|uniref:RDD family protein n=1 Tax=Streptomyces sp. NPDC004327 TaxID=3364699 RepID=UPI00367E08B4
MATPPGGGGDVPQAGYYPDPSIPGYIRFWNGGAWVPGTSRPAPKEDESAPGAPAAPTPPPAPSAPSVEETGPMFLDEDPVSTPSEPASAWQATTSQQTGFGGDRDQRVSWGRPDAADPRAAGTGWPAAAGEDAAHAGTPADGRAPAGTPADGRAPTAAPVVPGQGHGGSPAWPAAGGQADAKSGASAAADAAGDSSASAGPAVWPAAGQADARSSAAASAVRGSADAADRAPGVAPAAGNGAQGPGSAPAATPGRAGAVPGQGPVSAPAATPGPAGPGQGPGSAPATALGRAGAVPGQGPGSAPAATPGRAGAVPGQGPVSAPAVTPGQPAAGGPGAHPAWPAAGSQSGTPAAGPQSSGAPAAGPQSGTPAAASARLGGMPAGPAAGAFAPHSSAPWAPQGQQASQGQVGQAGQVGQSGQAGADSAPPVVPWKPPVDDPFLAAVREQAAARPAGMGRRLLARIVDGVVFGAAMGAVAYPFVSAALAHIEEKIEAARQSGVTVQVWLVDSTTAVQFGIVLAAFLVLGVVYEVLPTAKWGRTLGKKLCGIQVRDIEAHEPPTFGAALRRWLVYGVLGLIGVGVLNVLWCLFDRPWRQCWHDKAARTFVAG